MNTPTHPVAPNLSALRVTPDDAFFHLGYEAGDTPGPRDQLLMRGAIARATELLKPNATYRIVAVADQPQNGGMSLPEFDIHLPGKSLPNALCNVSLVAMIAVTVGSEIEQCGAELAKSGDVMGQVFLDAIASAAVENAADIVSEQLRRVMQLHELHTSMRFSPGYGDLPLSVQPAFETVLNMSETLGVTLTQNHILSPAKTITAFIGLRRTPYNTPATERVCSVCTLQNTCTRQTCRANSRL